jgi:hypothetical protein
MGEVMLDTEGTGNAGVHSEPRIRKRRRNRRKTKRVHKKRQPVLLLHKLKAAPGPKLRKKPCTRCKVNKFLKDFYLWKKPGRGPSYTSQCKACYSERSCERIRRVRKKKADGGDPVYQAYQREYYQRNKHKSAEYRRRFLLRHPDYFKIKSREYVQKNRERTAEARIALIDKDCT